MNEPTDIKIREQIKGGLFPIRLSPEERSSGETLWLLDIIAPDKKAATAVLLNFGKIAGDRPVRIHPAAAATGPWRPATPATPFPPSSRARH